MNAAEEYEAAKARVAKLQEELDGLQKKVNNEHGSLKALGEECKHEQNKTTGPLNVLRRKYNNTSADLRLAKRDLEHAKEKAEKEVLELKVANRPCDRCGRIPDGPMCKACGAVNDYKQFVPKPGDEDDKGDVDTPVEVKNEETLAKLEACMDHGLKKELKDGVAFCKECGAALDCHACSCYVVRSRCNYCTGKRDQNVAGDKFELPMTIGKEAIKVFWEGGPLDTVGGRPWHEALKVCPENEVVTLLPGVYEWEGRKVEARTTHDFYINGPDGMDPTSALTIIEGVDRNLPSNITVKENAPTYEELLAQYKDICREIEALGPNYGNPTAEERKLKKKRLELRKTLKAMAPLRTCWFCSGFSINNFDMPCREGALGRGDVPKEACDCWAVWSGSGGIDEKCLVAWPELQAMKEERALRDEDAVRDAKKTALQVMDANAQKAEARKSTGQTDLHGDVIKLPDGVKETKKVTKKREYTIEKFKLSINEKDLQNFPYVGLLSQRKLVVAKMRPLPDLDVDGDDWDDGINEMIKVLSRAAIILKSDLLKEALIVQRLKEVA